MKVKGNRKVRGQKLDSLCRYHSGGHKIETCNQGIGGAGQGLGERGFAASAKLARKTNFVCIFDY